MRPYRSAAVAVLLAALAIPVLAGCSRSTPAASQPSPTPSTTGGAPSRADATRALRAVAAREAPDFDVGSVSRLRVWQAQGSWHAAAQFNPSPTASSNSLWIVVAKRGAAWRLTTFAYVPPGGLPALFAQPTVAAP